MEANKIEKSIIIQTIWIVCIYTIGQMSKEGTFIKNSDTIRYRIKDTGRYSSTFELINETKRLIIYTPNVCTPGEQCAIDLYVSPDANTLALLLCGDMDGEYLWFYDFSDNFCLTKLQFDTKSYNNYTHIDDSNVFVSNSEIDTIHPKFEWLSNTRGKIYNWVQLNEVKEDSLDKQLIKDFINTLNKFVEDCGDENSIRYKLNMEIGKFQFEINKEKCTKSSIDCLVKEFSIIERDDKSVKAISGFDNFI